MSTEEEGATEGAEAARTGTRRSSRTSEGSGCSLGPVDPKLRSAFNRASGAQLFARYRAALERRVGDIPFRLAETPVFLPPALADRLARYATEIMKQLAEPARLRQMRNAVPARYDAPGLDSLPHCAQVDFALVRLPDGTLDARVVELQGFPSLYGFQHMQAAAWREATVASMPETAALSPFFDGLDEASAAERLRTTIVAAEDPAQVVLLDLAPQEQKTRPDFVATHALLGIDTVAPGDLVREGRRLWRDKNGKRIVVRRIFHRIVFDELDAKKTPMPFAYTDDLDVTFCPHPNWYWIWSKYSLLHLDHPAVPRTTLLSEVVELPAHLGSGWVLKPLFSFAGSGVNVDPSPHDVARIPASERHLWLLQQKVVYARELITPAGDGVAVEVRVMALRTEDGTELRPVCNLTRLSRGKMHGVDHNKDMEWTGSSVSLW
jgi:hypothetical protein